jgi:hypothetical protein
MLSLKPRRVVGFVMLALIGVAWATTVPFRVFGSSRRTESIAQTAGSGRINGSVYRDGGERVPAAIVVIFTPDGRMQRVTRTNAEGSFTFSGLPAAPYVIQGCAEEFGPSTLANVELKPGMDVTQDLTMGTGFVKTAEPSCSMDSTTDAPIPHRPHEYSGEIMSFDLKGDVRDFFRSIALISGLELDVDPSINSMVTMHLKNIPWDLALDVVLRTSGLGSERDG